MQTYECVATIEKQGFLRLPEHLGKIIEPRQKVRILVMLEDEEERAWNTFVAEQFINGYSEQDSIYDSL